MATRTIANGGGNWSSTSTWVEGAVPTSADDVVATGTSGNVVVNVASVCRSMILTGYVGTLSGSAALAIGDASGGGLTLSSGMTQSYTGSITFAATSTNGGVGWPITTNGKSIAGPTFSGTGGRWQLQGAITTTSTISISGGTLDLNGKTVNTTRMTCVGSSSIIGGISTINLSQTAAGSPWNMTASGTVSLASATIVFTQPSSNDRSFDGGGGTYGKFSFVVSSASTGALLFTGANTFNIFEVKNTGSSTSPSVSFPSGTTQTILTTLTLQGISTSKVALISDLSGTRATISSAGTIGVTNASIKDSAATGGASFVAASSTNVSNNTGWTFGQVANLNLVTEIDSVNAVTKYKNVNLNLLTDLSTLFSLSHKKQINLNQITELGTSYSIRPQHNVALSGVNSTDTVSSISITKRCSIGISSESNSLFVPNINKSINLGLTQENSSLSPLVLQRHFNIGYNLESNTIYLVSPSKRTTLSTLLDLEVAESITAHKVHSLSVLMENSTLFSTVPYKNIHLSPLNESTTNFGLIAHKSLVLGLAVENQTILPLVTFSVRPYLRGTLNLEGESSQREAELQIGLTRISKYPL